MIMSGNQRVPNREADPLLELHLISAAGGEKKKKKQKSRGRKRKVNFLNVSSG